MEDRNSNIIKRKEILAEINNVSFGYEGKQVLKDISLSLKKGASYSLIGKSGTGKSTLLNLIAGFISPQEGSIEINSKKITGTRKETAIMFQELALFPWQTVEQAVSMALTLSNKNDIFKKTQTREKVDSLLAELGILELKDKYPNQLSGGERQRTALARGLIGQPDLLLMDEPTSSLDSITKESIQELIRKQQEKLGATLLFVTHDIEEALLLGEKVLILQSEGSLCELDNPCYYRKEGRKSLAFYEQCIRFKELLEERK